MSIKRIGLSTDAMVHGLRIGDLKFSACPLRPSTVGLFTPREALCVAEAPNSKVADSDSTQCTIDLMSLTGSGRNHSKIKPVQK